MYPAVTAHQIMAGHAVLRNVERQRIALRQKLNAVIKRLRRHRPVRSRLREPRRTVYKFRLAVCAGADVVPIIYILSHKIKRLIDQLHILLCDLRKIRRKFFQPLHGVMSKEYRIGKPRYIPGPVIDRIVKSEIHLFRRLNVLRPVGVRIRHAAGRSETDLDRSDRISAQVDDRLPVRHQKMMRHQKRLRHGKLHARSMNTAQMSKTDHALRFVDRNKIFADVAEILGNHLRIFSEPLHHVRVLPAAPLIKRLREFPVKQRQVRRDAVFLHRENHIAVHGDRFLIHAPGSLRQNPRPVQ